MTQKEVAISALQNLDILPAYIKKFKKDQNALLAQGLTEEDIRIMLDLLL